MQFLQKLFMIAVATLLILGCWVVTFFLFIITVFLFMNGSFLLGGLFAFVTLMAFSFIVAVFGGQ